MDNWKINSISDDIMSSLDSQSSKHIVDQIFVWSNFVFELQSLYFPGTEFDLIEFCNAEFSKLSDLMEYLEELDTSYKKSVIFTTPCNTLNLFCSLRDSYIARTVFSYLLRINLTVRETESELYYYQQVIQKPVDVEVAAMVSRQLFNIIDVTDFHLPIQVDKVKFSSGAAVDAKGKSPYDKLQSLKRPHDLNEFFEGEILDILFDGCEVTHLSNSKLCLVPKNYAKKRLITIESNHNVFLQHMLRTQIISMVNKKYRYLVKFDQDVQRQFLRDHYSEYSTIDLKNASDTISHDLIYHLINHVSPDLYKVIKRFSLSSVICDNEVLDNSPERALGMGNPITFVVETLLFSAICLSVEADKSPRRRKPFSVYGDDIIVHMSSYDEVVRRLTLLGFTPNLSKSFKSGPFKESCGVDLMHGVNSTPVQVSRTMDYLFPLPRKSTEQKGSSLLKCKLDFAIATYNKMYHLDCPKTARKILQKLIKLGYGDFLYFSDNYLDSSALHNAEPYNSHLPLLVTKIPKKYLKRSKGEPYVRKYRLQLEYCNVENRSERYNDENRYKYWFLTRDRVNPLIEEINKIYGFEFLDEAIRPELPVYAPYKMVMKQRKRFI